MKKKARKVGFFLLYVLLGLSIVFSLLLGVLHFNEDKIKAYAEESINPYLNSPVFVKDISVDYIRQFPQIGILFKDVKAMGSYENTEIPLFTADEIYFNFNLWEILKQEYGFNAVIFKKMTLAVQIDDSGTANYHIINWPSDTTQVEDAEKSQKPINFNIKKLEFLEANVSYLNAVNQTQIKAAVPHLAMAGNFQERIFSIDSEGDIDLEKLQIEEDNIITSLPIRFQQRIRINQDAATYELESGYLSLAEQVMRWEGVYDGQASHIDFQVDNNAMPLKVIRSFLPKNYQKQLDPYVTGGDLSFSCKIQGSIADGKTPHISLKAGVNNGLLKHKAKADSIHRLSFNLDFDNGKHQSLESSTLKISPIHFEVMGEENQLHFQMHNFKDPYYDVSFEGQLPLRLISDWLPENGLEVSDGFLVGSALYRGTKDLTSPPIFIKSDLTIEGFQGKFTSEGVAQHFGIQTGHIEFNDHNLAIDDFKAQLNQQNFRLHLDIQEWPGMLDDKHPKSPKIQVNFQAPELYPEHIWRAQHEASGTDTSFSLAFLEKPLWKKMVVQGQFQVDTFVYEGFPANNLHTQLGYKNGVLKVSDFKGQLFEGKFDIRGTAGIEKSQLFTEIEANFGGIDIREIFKGFNNFGQEVLTHRHLKGKLNGHIALDFEATLKDSFQVIDSSISSFSNISILNGELIQFEPIAKLGGFVKVKKFSHLFFDTLNNQIIIEDKVIMVPEMHIASTGLEMQVHGKQTFDGEVDYRFKLNLSDFLFGKKKAPDETYGSIERDERNRLNLFISMEGSLDEPKFKYDTRSVAVQIKEGLKREKEALKDAFSRKRKQKTPDSKYEFEWDE